VVKKGSLKAFARERRTHACRARSRAIPLRFANQVKAFDCRSSTFIKIGLKSVWRLKKIYAYFIRFWPRGGLLKKTFFFLNKSAWQIYADFIRASLRSGGQLYALKKSTTLHLYSREKWSTALRLKIRYGNY
jgi:hypothetical protein